MAVNFPTIYPHQLNPITGLRLGTARAGIKKTNRRDILVIHLGPNACISGVFTQNRFCAAPVLVSKAHLNSASASGQTISALLVNTGCANAGTGKQGVDDANTSCIALAKHLGCSAQQVLLFSTGVILENLPMKRLLAGLPNAVKNLSEDHWNEAAEAIMTTDTLPKAASKTAIIAGCTVTVTGIAKGAGMIRPNMATMLGFIATDTKISQLLLDSLIQEIADVSFNSITIDGDTSTNDSFMLIANGSGSLHLDSRDAQGFQEFVQLITEVAQTLAQMIVRDGEGATKFITIQVNEGKNTEECRKIAYAIAHSPLVKTAFFASDPNLGRILAAIGYAGVDQLDVNKVDLYLDNVWVAKSGERNPNYREEDGQRVMKNSEITVRVMLGRGSSNATVWTCDLSHDYVSINADYRS